MPLRLEHDTLPNSQPIVFYEAFVVELLGFCLLKMPMFFMSTDNKGIVYSEAIVAKRVSWYNINFNSIPHFF